MYAWDDLEPGANVRLSLADIGNLNQMELPLRICARTEPDDPYLYCTVQFKPEHFAAPYGSGILAAGHTYSVSLDDPATPGAEWLSPDLLQVLGNP
jgi:hypothetical protein